MTIDDLREKNLIVLECISGSRAYGLDTPDSDTDIKGVFILPKRDFYSLNYISQVSNETNDIVFYELGRFIELLSQNNPNILELLNTPLEAIIYKHEFLNEIDESKILSKLCKDTFGKFAISQIKKAKGLNKKIVNPFRKEKKSILDFCYVSYDNGSIALKRFLELKNWKQENCGMVNINNMKDLYGLYHNENINYKGIMRNEYSNEISLSSIPKDEIQEGILYFNKDGYIKYGKEYKEYWEWVKNRNEQRYENTKSHGKNYDSKNMMHTFRLLDMAIEIGKFKKVNVKRENRDYLLHIKVGEFEYDELLRLAKEKQDELEDVFENSDLQEYPNMKIINDILYNLREKFYDRTT